MVDSEEANIPLLRSNEVSHTTCYAPVYILIVFFSISSWISANGLFVEIPIFVERLPEGWSLPSYMVIVVQAANVGLLFWSLFRYKCKPNETAAIYFLFSLAAVGTILVGIFWEITVTFGETQHSVPLLALTAIISLVDCLSGVVFLPFIAHFQSASYVTAYYVGSSMGGLIPGVIGLVQGVGSDPVCVNSSNYSSTDQQSVPVYPPVAFSVELFCFVLCAFVVISAASFTILICGRRCKQDMMGVDSTNVLVVNTNNLTTDQSDHQLASSSSLITDQLSDTRSWSTLFKLLGLIFIVNLLQNGILPAMQSFSCLPYGRLVYTLAIRLSLISSTFACLVSLFWPTKSLSKATVMTTVGIIMSVYQIVLASLSPNPIWQHSVFGQILVVLTSVVLMGLFAYVRVVLALILRNSDGANGLFWCGLATQAGSCLGAIVAFVLVNVFKLFVSQPLC